MKHERCSRDFGQPFFPWGNGLRKDRLKVRGSKNWIVVSKSEWKAIENHHEPLVMPGVFTRVAVAVAGHFMKRKRENIRC